MPNIPKKKNSVERTLSGFNLKQLRFQSVLNLRLSALNWQIITSYIELVYQIYVYQDIYIFLANVWKKYIRQSRNSPAQLKTDILLGDICL